MKQEYLSCKEALQARINAYKLDPYIKKLQLNSKDPHVQELIDAVSLVQGALKYEVDNLGNEAYETLLLNLGLVRNLPAKVIVNSKAQQFTYISEGTLVSGGGYLWQVSEATYIAPFTLVEKYISQLNNEAYLNLVLEGEGPPTCIEFLFDEYLIDAIFVEGIQVSAKLWNRSNYHTNCLCTLICTSSMREYEQLNEQTYRVRIEGIDSRGINQRFTIAIPLYTTKFVTVNNIFINPIILKNSYAYQLNLKVQSSGPYQLDLGESKLLEVHSIKERQYVESLKEHIDGWYVLPNNTIYFQKAYEEPLYINCLISNDYIGVKDYNFYFQEYNGVQIDQLVNDAPPQPANENNQIKYIIQELYNYSLEEFFNYYIKHYDLHIELIHKEQKIVPYRENNYVVNRVINSLHCYTQDSVIKNYILFQTINKKFPVELNLTTKYGTSLVFTHY